MISVTTLLFDLNGAKIFRASQLDQKKVNENNRWERRVSRTATLDGGVAVCDNGYAAGDRDITIKVPDASREIVDWMEYITKTYDEVWVSTDESVFKGDPSLSYVDADGSAIMIINLIEDLIGG